MFSTFYGLFESSEKFIVILSEVLKQCKHSLRFSKLFGNICPNENLHANAYTDVVPNCQNLEASKTDAPQQVTDKETVAHPDTGMFFARRE